MSEWLSQNELKERGIPVTCRVHKTVSLPQQDCTIGDHCTIDQGASIHANQTCLGDWCHIGPDVQIQGQSVSLGFNCVVFARATIMALGDLSLGPWSKISGDCSLRAGTIRIGCEMWINRGAEIGGGGWQSPESLFEAGDRCHIGRNTHVNTAAAVSLGDDTALGMDCIVATHANWQPVTEGYASRRGPVCIASNVAVYSKSVIGPGVTISAGATIAAGSIVIDNVPDRALVAGAPAKVIQIQNDEVDTISITANILKNIAAQNWPEADARETSEGVRVVLPGVSCEIVCSSEVQTSKCARMILLTSTAASGTARLCVFNVKHRYIDGFADSMTELLRGELFRYGLRFTYRNYERNRLDPKALEKAGYA